MTVTIKQIEQHMEQMESTMELLAGCRSTIHALATGGNRIAQRAIDAEKRVAELEEAITEHLPLMERLGVDTEEFENLLEEAND